MILRCIFKKKIGESTRKNDWSEPSHYLRANSPVRNFARTVPEESSREELVLVRTVPEPSSIGAYIKISQIDDFRSCTMELKIVHYYNAFNSKL